MLVGIRSRWKQVIAYHFTGYSIQENKLQGIIHELVRLAEGIGFRVHFVVSDCGPSNKRYWKDEGLQFSKSTVLESKAVPHPVDNARVIEIMPDAVHVFKSAMQGCISNITIKFPESVITQNGLTTRFADINHLTELVQYEQNNQFKLASKLTLNDVNFNNGKRNNFDKMKVINS